MYCTLPDMHWLSNFSEPYLRCCAKTRVFLEHLQKDCHIVKTYCQANPLHISGARGPGMSSMVCMHACTQSYTNLRSHETKHCSKYAGLWFCMGAGMEAGATGASRCSGRCAGAVLLVVRVCSALSCSSKMLRLIILPYCFFSFYLF